MHVGHEGVKMRPALARPLDRVEEHVHQHRLAAADWPMDVKAARRLSRLHAEQSRETARLSFRLIVFQFVGERVELADELRLRGVGLRTCGRRRARGNARRCELMRAPLVPFGERGRRSRRDGAHARSVRVRRERQGTTPYPSTPLPKGHPEDAPSLDGLWGEGSCRLKPED